MALVAAMLDTEIWVGEISSYCGVGIPTSQGACAQIETTIRLGLGVCVCVCAARLSPSVVLH